MTTVIHVNKHIIGKNNKHGTNDAPISIRRGRGGKAAHAHAIEVLGPCRIVHSPDKPLKCGAKVWIETDAELLILES